MTKYAYMLHKSSPWSHVDLGGIVLYKTRQIFLDDPIPENLRRAVLRYLIEETVEVEPDVPHKNREEIISFLVEKGFDVDQISLLSDEDLAKLAEGDDKNKKRRT